MSKYLVFKEDFSFQEECEDLYRVDEIRSIGINPDEEPVPLKERAKRSLEITGEKFVILDLNN
jgi:hypothetical protein